MLTQAFSLRLEHIFPLVRGTCREKETEMVAGAEELAETPQGKIRISNLIFRGIFNSEPRHPSIFSAIITDATLPLLPPSVLPPPFLYYFIGPYLLLEKENNRRIRLNTIRDRWRKPVLTRFPEKCWEIEEYILGNRWRDWKRIKTNAFVGDTFPSISEGKENSM